MSAIWAVMPFVDLWDEYTRAAAEDVLAQEQVRGLRLLLVSNGSRPEEREKAEAWTRQHWDRVLLWHHNPPLPALGCTWNEAADFCFAGGAAPLVWVVNNDARFAPLTLQMLATGLAYHDGIFCSGVGVREEQFSSELPELDPTPRGGPDYSCFLLKKEGWERFPFDPHLTYTGDVDHHRTVMLSGEGDRIFSVNVPYLHYASRTINRSEAALQEHHRVNAQHHAYFERKWGGPVNAERWALEFRPESAAEGLTTPELFAKVREGWARGGVQ